jgi:DedD protein
MGMQEPQDTEVTLGTGRLLGLFFGLVVVCALFFSVGFSLGRKSAPVAPVTSVAPVPAPLATSTEPKPTPLRVTEAGKTDCAPPETCPQQDQASTSNELTFYKAVEEKDAKARLDQPAPNPQTVFSSNADPKAPEITKPATLGAGYMVQIAAVSKQEDAEALVAALRKKQYPVFSTTLANDKLFHVQVGPFPDAKAADDMKSKLVGDGYNPIVKK